MSESKHAWCSAQARVAVIPVGRGKPKMLIHKLAFDGSIEDLADAVNATMNACSRVYAPSHRVSLSEVLVWNKDVKAWADKTLDCIDAMLPEGLK